MPKTRTEKSVAEQIHRRAESTWSQSRLFFREAHQCKTQLVIITKSYLFENLEKDPGFNELAEDFYVSPRTLSRRFRKVGVSYRDIVHEVKKEMAMTLLQDLGTPVSVIARRLGYNDPSNFTKAFKLWVGQCPRAYRYAHAPRQRASIR